MTSRVQPQPSTAHSAIDPCVATLIAAAGQPGHTGTVSDSDLARLMTAAVRLYAARSEVRESYPAPVNTDEVTATDVVVVVCEMIRAVDLNLFDLSMWFNRPRREE